MTAEAGSSKSFTPINPDMINDEYVIGVAVPAIVVDTNKSQHDGISEADLIARVNLASCEKDVRPHKGSTSSSLPDGDGNQCCKNDLLNDPSAINDDGELESRIRSSSECHTIEDAGDTVVFYETQFLDESSLIAYAKLAGDGINSGQESLSKLHQSPYADDDTKYMVETESSNENGCGYKTPTNSIADDSATVEKRKQVMEEPASEDDVKQNVDEPVARDDDKQLVNTEDTTDDTGVTDDMSNDRDFRKLMDRIMVDLQDCDVEDIIRIFVGTGIVEEGHLTGYVSTEQVVAQLRKYRFISRDNLHHIQSMIMRLDDTELYFRCIQYLKHNHDVVFFYQEQEQMPKGFGVVRCFIGGRDFTRLSREDIELTRFKVASMVFMPAQSFYIVGIEPGQRVVVSLMALERYVDELHVMAKEGLPELNLIGVEAIQIHNRTYSTEGRAAVDVYWARRTTSYASVYRQLKEKCERVEEQDREIHELREELEFLQLEVDTFGAEIDVIENSRGSLFGRSNRRSRSRSDDRRSRARSMPPRSNRRAEVRRNLLAITSGSEKGSNQSLHTKPTSPTERQKYSGRHTYSDDNDVTFRRSRQFSPNTSTSTEQSTRVRFYERDRIMHEIETILDEISFVQSTI